MIKSILTAVPPAFPQYAATPRCWKDKSKGKLLIARALSSNTDGIELRTISRDAGYAQSGVHQVQKNQGKGRLLSGFARVAWQENNDLSQ
jgi:hypothetical protein